MIVGVRRTALHPFVVPVAAVVFATGCTGGSTSDVSRTTVTTAPVSTSGTSGHVGLRATVVQQRLDVGTRRIGLEVTTDSRTTLHVDSVQLLTEAFEPQPATPKDTDFVPRQTTDLTVDHADAVCRAGISADDARVVIGYASGTGAGEVTLPVARLGVSLLNHLHDEGCAHQDFVDAVALTYNTPFHRQVVDGRLSLVGELDLVRPADGGSGERVVVESVLGSVLFEFIGLRPGRRPAGQVGARSPSSSVPVLIRGNDRCDPHARSASQQTFIFTADVRVGRAPVHREIIEPPRSLQRQALALLDDVC